MNRKAPAPPDRQRHLPIPGSYNIRDLGGYPTRGGGTVGWRRFLRADSLHRLDRDGIDRLLQEGVTTVIDLRTPAEIAQAPNPLRDSRAVTFVNRPLFDDLAPASLGRARAEAADPLLQFYLAALRTRQAAFRDILSAMAEAAPGTVLFNCTAGKDRTGLVAALLLGVAEVPRADIIADYVLTDRLIPDLVAEFLDLSRRRGGDVTAYARMLKCPAPTMAAALDKLEADHGGIAGYLGDTGLPADTISKLKLKLGEHTKA